MKATERLHAHQRVQDAAGNKGRVLNPDLRNNMVRVRMDTGWNRDYDKSTLKPLTFIKDDAHND